MHRFFLVSLIALIALVIPVSTSAAQAHPMPTDDPVFEQFQGRVCRMAAKQNEEVAPWLLRFNQHYYNEPHSPEALEAAGQEYRQVYAIWSKWAERMERIEAPAPDARLWDQLWREQDEIIALGDQLVEALEAADLPTFQRLERENVRRQIQRNRTISRIGIVCP